MHFREMLHVLALEKSLRDVEANSLVDRAWEHYRQFSAGMFHEIPFQKDALESALRSPDLWWNGEIGTGGGKTIVQALLALEKVQNGPVLYICPSATSLGDSAQGILQKFFFVFEKKAPLRFELGDLNEATLSKDVLFFTPRTFVNLSRQGHFLFDEIMERCSTLILDEGHHFPDDACEMRVFGDIRRIARERIVARGKPVYSFTATHYRMDGRPLGGVKYRLPLQQICSEGWCPEIYSAPVYLDIRCPRATRNPTWYSLNLEGAERDRYIDAIVDCMLVTRERRPGSCAVFCSYVRDVRDITSRFNARSAPGAPGLLVLTGETPKAERREIQKDIIAGRALGYVTCNVGAESIDIPRIEVIHMVHRTRSISYLVQAVGRGTRPHPEKRNLLIVDYHVQEKRILQGCVGAVEYARAIHSNINAPRNGGPLVTRRRLNEAAFVGALLEDEKQFMLKQFSQPRDADWRAIVPSYRPIWKESPGWKRYAFFNAENTLLEIDFYDTSSSEYVRKVKFSHARFMAWWRGHCFEEAEQGDLTVRWKKITLQTYEFVLGAHEMIFLPAGKNRFGVTIKSATGQISNPGLDLSRLDGFEDFAAEYAWATGLNANALLRAARVAIREISTRMYNDENNAIGNLIVQWFFDRPTKFFSRRDVAGLRGIWNEKLDEGVRNLVDRKILRSSSTRKGKQGYWLARNLKRDPLWMYP